MNSVFKHLAHWMFVTVSPQKLWHSGHCRQRIEAFSGDNCRKLNRGYCHGLTTNNLQLKLDEFMSGRAARMYHS